MAARWRVLLLLPLILLAACRIEIRVPEGGRVQNLEGSISCGPGETCELDISGFFDEAFIAVPEPGFVFTAWKPRNRSLCAGRSARCYLSTVGFDDNPLVQALLASDDVFFLVPEFSRQDALASFDTIEALPGGGNQTVAGGISPDGSAIIGSSEYGFGPGDFEAFRWTAGEGTVGLGDLPGLTVNSEAYGASLRGTAVTGCGTSDEAVEGLSSVREAFRWTLAGGMQPLGDFDGGQYRSCGLAISADGSTVVGVGRTARGDEAFRWRERTGFSALDDLPGGGFESVAFAVSSGGQIAVGYSTSGRGVEAVRWRFDAPIERLGDLPGGRFRSVATAMSLNSDVVAGRGEVDYLLATRTPVNEAFVWTEANGLQGLGFLRPRQRNSEPTPVAVAADGDVIVGNEGSRPWLWTRQHGLRELQDVLIAQGATELTGWLITSVRGMSSDGRTLTGEGNGPFGERVWVATFNPRFPN
ncbi:MAG: hypothetical protein AAGI11_06875 [Pseudomonadota bacterium]